MNKTRQILARMLITFTKQHAAGSINGLYKRKEGIAMKRSLTIWMGMMLMISLKEIA